jgi:hypothetical protein
MRGCKFCGSTEGLLACTWPVIAMRWVLVGDLKIGDSMRKSAFLVQVLSIKLDWRIDGHLLIGVEHERGTTEFLSLLVHGRVQVEKKRLCDTICCDLHCAERGPGEIRCAEHWRAEICGEPPKRAALVAGGEA